jgi:hypothetical protein
VGKFIQQPVTISQTAKRLLTKYITLIRPIIRSRCREEPNNMDKLFLDFEGKPHLRLGRLVTQYFSSKQGGYHHITTTSLRSLVETQATILQKAGSISSGDLASIQNINGHSAQTSEEFYVKNRVFSDVEAGNKVFKLFSSPIPLVPTMPVAEYNDDDEEPFAPMQSNDFEGDPSMLQNHNNHCDLHHTSSQSTGSINELQVLQHQPISEQQSFSITQGDNLQPSSLPNNTVWGILHPHFSEPNRERAVWSDAELDYLGRVTETFLKADNNDRYVTYVLTCSIIENDQYPYCLQVPQKSYVTLLKLY